MMDEMAQIVFHPSEWSVKPIALNPSIEKLEPPERFEPRALPFKPFPAEALLSMRPQQVPRAIPSPARFAAGPALRAPAPYLACPPGPLPWLLPTPLSRCLASSSSRPP